MKKEKSKKWAKACPVCLSPDIHWGTSPPFFEADSGLADYECKKCHAIFSVAFEVKTRKKK